MFICTACSKADKPKKIDYNTIIELQDNINNTAPTEKANKITGDNETETTREDEKMGDSLKTKSDTPDWDWPAEMNFTGVKSDMKGFKLGNLSTNIKLGSRRSCLICPDIKNNTIYYMSRNDGFIHKQEDEKDTLLIDMQAHNLQLWDNKLYFINIIEADFYFSGPIYSYDLETKELELILDKNVASFYIDNFGIYYTELEPPWKLSVSLLDFNNQITSLENYPWVVSYNEYLLTSLDGYLSLVNRYTDEIIKIMPFEDNVQVISTIHIFEDMLVFAVDKSVYILNLKTGEKSKYSAEQADKLLAKLVLFRIEDFAFINNNIVASYGSKNLFKIDLSKNEIRHFIRMDNESLWYSNLQTDGERLIASINKSNPTSWDSIVIGYDEVIFPTEGNVLSRKVFGK